MVERAKGSLPGGDRIKAVPTPATGTATCVCACKIPNGVILRTFKMLEQTIRVHGMVSTELLARETGKRFVVRGPALAFGQLPNIQITGGFALTPGVPRDLAQTWLEQNKDSDIVRNSLIFFENDMERATARSKELSSVRSGLEPIDPTKLPREFVKKIETADLTDK